MAALDKYRYKHHICPECEKDFSVQYGTNYVYKKTDERKSSETRGRILYFCSASCMRSFEEKNPHRKYMRVK